MPGESGRPAGTEVALTEADDWLDHESGVARLEGPADTHEAFFLAALTEDWLQSVGDTPFFLRVDPWGPHPPYIVTSDFLDLVEPADVALPANFSFDLAGRPAHHRRYRDYWQQTLALQAEGWRRMTAAALAHAALVETALLKVLALLDRLGLAERTLVVFTADHGDAVGSNGGVANKGGLLVEETTHIPLVVRGPGIPAGRNCDHLATNLDLAPTLLTLRGLAGDAGCQGRRLFEADGRLPARGRPDLMLQHYGLHEPIAQRAYYRDGWKLVAQEDGFAELYDLRADPYELHNRADAPEDRDRLEALWAGLRSAMQDCGDTSPRLTKILDGPPG